MDPDVEEFSRAATVAFMRAGAGGIPRLSAAFAVSAQPNAAKKMTTQKNSLFCMAP